MSAIVSPAPPAPVLSGWVSRLVEILSLLLIGLGIGWLVGLSVSPVVSGVITSLLTVAGGLVVATRAIARRQGSTLPEAWPAALLVLGIALGASGGSLARTNGLLGPLHRSAADPQATASNPADRGVLFGATLEECEQVRSAWIRGNRDAFVREFAGSSLPRAQELAARVQDPETLRLMVEALCGK